jgi:hypothetical protein
MPQGPYNLNCRANSAVGVGKPVTVAGTARTLSPSDLGKYLRFTNGSAVALTVPANATTALPIGQSISGVQAGAGQVTITAAGGVTINAAGAKVATAAQFAAFTLTKVGINEWDLAGDLA